MEMGIYEAKSKLSGLVKLAMEGEEVILTKNKEPVVKIVPYENTRIQKPADKGNHDDN